MSEFLRTKIAATGLMVALGCTACASGGSSEHGAPAKSHPARPANYSAPVGVEYLSNGMREVFLQDIKDKNDPSDNYFQNILEWCENGDMLLQTDGYDVNNDNDNNDTNATSVAIRPNDPVCADGKLTPSDFPRTPSEQH